VPSPRIAAAVTSPALIAVTPVRPDTGTGSQVVVTVLPLPSWPWSLPPHERTVPSARSA
jgi:hypothetical protein